MPVNGGSANQITFSELQTYYGGSHPINLSEYYRGGTQVPGDLVAAQSNVSGTADQTVGQFSVDVTSTTTYTGALEGTATQRMIQSATSGSSVSGTYTVLPSDAVIVMSGGGLRSVGGEDPPEASGSWSATGVVNTGTVGSGQPRYYRGPAYQSGDYSQLSFSGTAGVGTITMTSSVDTAGGSVRLSTARRAGVTTHGVSFTNNSASTITTTSGSTGGAQSYSAGQTRAVVNGGSSTGWTLGYNAVLGNTNIPASGEISLSQFNDPGNPTP